MKKNIKLAQIGCGYWGPNLLRNFYKLDNVQIPYLAEKNAERRKYVKSNYKDVEITDDYTKILHDDKIDAVVIATPAQDHYEHAKDVLSSGKHCFVEKPLAMKTNEARELVSLAEKKNKILMVGHTFLYNAAVHKLKEEIDKGTLGEVYYIYSQRLSLGRIRTDINAMWNFAPHDVSICLFLIDSELHWVSAIGACYVQPTIEDVVFLSMGFKNGVIANVHISWLDPNKVRRMTVVGSNKMIIYDDVAEYKIQVFDRGIDKMKIGTSLGTYDDFGKFQLIQRAGDLLIPKIDFVEPLETEAKHFIDCIIKNKRPISDGHNGIMVTQILETGLKSLASNGARIELHE